MSLGATLSAYFSLDEHDTDLRTEILAGMTTFLTISYIVVANPAILAHYGIAAGIIAYPVVKAARGEWDAVSLGLWTLAGAFVCYFFVRTSGLLAGQL